MPPTKASKSSAKSAWPPILRRKYPSGQVGYMIAVMIDGQRIRETFPSREEAKERAQQIRALCQREGAAAFSLPADQRAVAAKCLERLQPYGTGLDKAVDYYIEKVLKYREAPTIADAVKRLLVEKEQKNLRPSTMIGLRHRWGKFSEAFGNLRLNEVTGEMLTKWLVEQARDPVSRHNYRRKINSLYRLAIKRKWTADNPVEETERPEMAEATPGVLRAKQVARLLEKAEDYRLTAYAALGFFAGVRPDELLKLDWRAVNIKRRQIVIGPLVAKTKQQRILALNDTALAWLVPCVKHDGPVVAGTNFRKRFDAWRKAAGIKVKDWPPDCIRHSFGSYHYAANNNPVETARLMGHVGVDVFFRHYRALVDEDEAKIYWSLRPAADAAGKIVPMRAASA